VALAGLHIMPVNPNNVHAPYWVLSVFGFVFMGAGTMLIYMAWQQSAANKLYEEMRKKYPGEPALADHPWNTKGFAPPRWMPVIKSAAGMIFVTGFLSIFNWWAFFANGPPVLKIIVALFDLVFVFFWCRTFILLGRAVKFPGSQIIFQSFPLPASGPVLLHWRCASDIQNIRKGTFTLRCIEEHIIVTGASNDKNVHLAHDELWSGTWHIENSRNISSKDQMDLEFTPPAGAPPTSLNADKPVFWELEVRLDLPGLGFREKYLVPVYAIWNQAP
jgi:hypothetical protein